jgi:hypothetical protein
MWGTGVVSTRPLHNELGQESVMSRPRIHPLPKIGDRTGKYTVIEEPTNAQKILCRCDCGTERRISAYHLRIRPNLSCGCDVVELNSKRKIRHGNAKRHQQTHEYKVWCSMHRRCKNPSQENYERYGGRGITVCERWKSFTNFLADMGTCPSTEYTIGRKNNDGNYEPGNCRWETDEEQRNNKRSSVFLTYDGKRMTITQWARHLGWPKYILHGRKRLGWSDEKILTTPPTKRN